MGWSRASSFARGASAKLGWLGVWLWLIAVLQLWAGEPGPLLQAHAHNDYEHTRPLLDALSHGFCSVEADVHLVNGQLLVAHDSNETRPGRTLQALYLDPLQERVTRNGGSVYPVEGGKPNRFILLVDIKTEAEATYRLLDEVLARYRGMLTRTRTAEVVPGAVTVILSGNRPREMVAAQQESLASIDGRLPDLEGDSSAALIPLISDNWRSHFRWNGRGEISPEERGKLGRLVQQAHDQHRLIRFWAVPDEPAAWELLRKAGVDLINTDKLAELETFLRGPD